MTLTEYIPQADSPYTIYFLLTSYIDVVRFGHSMPRDLTTRPLASAHDVSQRFATLVVGLDAASRRLDNIACSAIRETMNIFALAMDRLQFLGAVEPSPGYIDHRLNSTRRLA